MKNKLYEALFPVINDHITAHNGGLALTYVLTERERQDAKWGETNHDPFTYLTILMEEVGELAQAALETRFGGTRGGLDKMRNEAVQTAAVALAIVECLDRAKWEWPTIATLEPPESKPSEPECCVWEEDDDGVWGGSCGEAWEFTHDGPLENRMHYCPKCGKPIRLEARP